jgi:glycosyltransferase involved in cell wall biosynthesis
VTTPRDPCDVKVSVCIINFNYARFLPDAIESALDQDHPNLEVIVIDDGSTDASVSVAHQYAPSVRTLRKANGGQGSAVNAAFTAATGDVVFFLDADDMLAPGTVARAASAFADDPTIAKTQFFMEIVDGTGISTGRLIPGTQTYFPSGDLSKRVLQCRNYPWPPSSANAYSSAALDIVLPVPEQTYRGDTDCYLAETVPLCGPIRSIAHVGAYYRWHGANDFAGSAGGVAWLHHKMDLVDAGHDNVRDVALKLGIPLDDFPDDVAQLNDVAYLGVRLASLRLDPAAHPLRGDRAWALAARGIVASIRHPYLSVRARMKRVAWFMAAGFLTRSLARSICSVWVPDGPYRPRWQAMFGRGRDVPDASPTNGRTHTARAV